MLQRTLLFSALVFGLASTCSLVGQTSGAIDDALVASHPADRIAGPIDDQQRIVLAGNRHPMANPQFDLGEAPAGHRMERMILALQADAAQQAALNALIEAQHTPGSPHYQQWISPETYATNFGVSGNDLQQITNWLSSHGLNVESVSASGHSITFSGTAAQVESAFHTQIHTYQVGGELHYANAGNPEIPAALAGIVAGVVSMNDFHSKPMHTTVQSPVDQVSTGARHITPADFSVIYDLTPLYSSGINGTGQTIAIAGRTDINLSDIQLFRSTYGLPANVPRIIVNGPDPGILSLEEEAEADLDIEWAGAVAQGATIKFVVSSSTSASDGALLSAQYIVENNLASVMSMSFGLCESALGASENTFLNDLWQQAAAEGITVIVASGDSGAAGCDDPSSTMATGGLAVNGLASTPYNTSVGGTILQDVADPSLYWSSTNTSTTQASALGYIPEDVWNESGASGLWSSGGGVSTIYAKPAWQAGIGVPADGQRDLPDVALTAASHDGYSIYINKSLAVVGGTSAATPSFAGLMAMVVQSAGARQGNVNPALYALATRQRLAGGAAVFHDIVSGNNSVPRVTGYSAGLGYDRATGLGSVNASLLVTHWGDAAGPAPAFQVSLSANSISLAPSASTSLQASVTVTAGFQGLVTLGATGLPPGLRLSLTPSRFAAPGSGTSAMQFIAAANVATGVYNITISAMSSGITQTAPLTVAVLSPANYALTVSPAAVTVASGNNSTVTITTAAGLGFNGDVSLHASPLPPGTSATFSPAAIAAPGSGNSTLTLAAGANTPAGTYKVTITATARLVTKTATLTLTVVPGPNYALAVTTNMLNIFPGYNATLPITTSADAAFNAAVKLTVSGLPSGVTATFAPASIAAPGSGASILKLSATSTTTPGGYSFTITAASGNIVRTMQPILMVTNPATSSPPPVLFYSDLDSGPATGGEGGTDGAFVCVYGENFGATQGASTLTLGGVELSAYKLWSDPGAPYTPGYYAKACGQISHLSPSGPRTLQLTTANGGSNALPFTVRPGAIYWVTTTGSNTKGTGSQAKPWATITKCRTEVGIGGICLIGNGVVLNTVDGTNIALRLDSSGSGTTTDSCGLDYSTPCGPKTIVAYPGAAVSVDVHTLGTGRALQSYSTTGDVSYWTIAGMLFNGNDFSVRFQYGTNIRFIDNEVLCGGANCDWSSDSAGLNTKYMNYLWLYGNRFHDIGCHEDDSTPTSYLTSPEHCAGGTTYTAVSSSGTTLTTTYAMSTVLVSGDVITINGQLRRTIKSSQQRVGANEQYTLDAPFSPDIASGSVTSWHWRDYAPSKEFHNIYFSTNTNDVWFGWNSVNGNGKACRGVLFNSTGGSPQYDLHVHDNLIHDTVCDGINFSTIDPSRGVVEAYNNVIYNAGTGPDPIDGPAYYTCILNQGGGSGTIQVYNNTLYNCGNNPAAFYPGDRGAVSSKSKLVTLSLTNNIIAQTGGIPYQAASSISSTLTGAANLFYGSGLAPNELSTAAIDSQNPQFVDISAQNFHLQAASPAIGSGTRVLAAHTDLDGIMQGSPYSLGAYGTPPR